MKKTFAKVLIAALAILMFSFPVFAQGASEAQSSSGSSGKVTITFMHDWPEYEEKFNEIVAGFEAENPDIRVETTVITWDILTKTLTTSFATGEAFDVAACWLDRVGGFDAVGACYDFTADMDADGGEWRNEFIAPSLQLGTVNGKVLGIPFRSTCTVLVYNSTLMEKYGWKEPETLEEFEALLAAAKAEGLIPLIAPGNPEGFQLHSILKTFAEHEMYRTGVLLKDEYLCGRYYEVADEFAKAGERLRDWMNKGYIPASALALTASEASSLFYSQKGLVYFANNNELAALESNSAEAGFKIRFMPFPSPEGVPTILYNYGVDGWMVYSGTKHPAEAVRFLKYISSTEVQQKFGLETLSVMGNRNCIYKDEYQNDFVEIFSDAKSYRIKFDYLQGSLVTDEALAVADFVADPSISAEAFGEKIREIKKNCIEERAGK